MLVRSTLPAIALSLAASLGAQTPRLIVETDFGGDTDDAALVAFAHRLADLGLVELLAVMHNGNNPWGAAAISAINAYYGRPELPIGTYRTAAEAGRPEYDPLVDPSDPSAGRRPLGYLGPTLEGHWVRLLAQNFPSRYAERLAFPDAVEVYRDALATAPDHSVVIVNGGHLGNLSNLFAWFEHDAAFRATFERAVARIQAAVGGVNTCVPEMFPPGMAEHVFNNTRVRTATMAWLGDPELDGVALETDASMATGLSLDHPVREAYRFKKEVEHGHRHTSLMWRWHIIDVATAFGVLGHDWVDAAGVPYFDPLPAHWLDVVDNCFARVVGGATPNPLWAFDSVRIHQQPGESLAQASSRLQQRFFADGIYAPPADPGSPERDHLAITAMFEDGTYGGFDLMGGPDSVAFIDSRLVVPISTDALGLVTEGRRYVDQTAILRFRGLPQQDRFDPAMSHSMHVDWAFWGDDRGSTHWGASPVVRVVGWPGRGFGHPASPGLPVYRVEFYEERGGSYGLVAHADLANTPVGAPFSMRVRVDAGTVQCFVNDEAAFAQPVVLQSSPPFDGGMSKLLLHGVGIPDEVFDLDYVLLRPHGGGAAVPDVHVDKAGTVFVSYVMNGDFAADLFDLGGKDTHLVDLSFRALSAGSSPQSMQLAWSEADPTDVDWVDVVTASDWRGLHTDHFVYRLPALPWHDGDSIVVEYRGRREGEAFVSAP